MRSNIELHVHPFLDNNTLTDVVEAMDKQNLDIVGLEVLNDSLYPIVVEEARKIYPKAAVDNSGVRFPNGKYLLNAREYDTKERLHILTVGYSMNEAVPDTEIRRIIDNGLANNAFVLLDHPFVDNINTRTAGHISDSLEQELEKICKEYSGQIALEWNGYCIQWMRYALKQGLNLAGFDIRYHDVNERAEQLSGSLRKQGYNVPVVADTDLHARSRGLLQAMGTSRIIADVQGETARDAVDSMKKNIFAGAYENFKRYVSFFHLLRAFCFPILFKGYFKKPRA